MADPGKRRVILDCDPGHDDAVAILLAAKHLDVLGITTVGGNAGLEDVTRNALRVVELGGLTAIPVVRGIASPLVSEPRAAPSVHGESGLDGFTFPPVTTKLHGTNAVGFIIDTVMAAGPVTLVPTGPLTNIATALRIEPRLRDRVAEICLMGGSATTGNATAAAEFNAWADPEAAHVVFSSGIPIKMCGLNLTRQASIGADEIAALRGIGNRVSDALSALLEYYRAAVEKLRGEPTVPLHDPCAVAALVDPGMITFEPMHVDVELHGMYTRGMTVCDRRFAHGHPSAPAPNADVGVTIDRERFLAFPYDTLRMYGD